LNWRRRKHGTPPPASPTTSPTASPADAVETSPETLSGPAASAPPDEDVTPPPAPPRPLPTEDLGDVPTEEPPPPSTSQAIVLAVTNQKGGVGKTTTTVSLGAALAADGHDVLVVDLDPQGNATTGLGLRVSEGAPSTYRVIVEQMALEDAAEPTAVRRLHIVPSSLDLAGAEIELVPQFSREHRLRSALDAVRDQYDVVLVDCPPSLGLLTVNALVAADQVLVPIQCEYYALEGLGQLMRTIEMVRTGLNRDLSLGGVLMTMFDGRTNLSQQVVDEVRGHFGDRAYGTVIPRTVRLSEAPSYGQPITEFDPSSRGARAYQRLAREIARRLGLTSGDDRPISPLDALLGEPDASNGAANRDDARESSESDDTPFSASGHRSDDDLTA
jgi:chromosome partitioning protein